MFQCDNYLDKCHGKCCGVFPFDINFFNKWKHMAEVNYTLHLFGKLVVAATSDNTCVFLKNNKCSVYDDRPELCRLFGKSNDEILQCPYQNCDGIQRTRQERRNIERSLSKLIKKKVKLISKYCKG